MNKPLKYTLFFLPTVIIFVVLLYFSDLQAISTTLASIPVMTYIIVLAIYAFSWLIRGERWKSMLKQNNVKTKLIPATGLAAFGNYANWIVPARIGDLGWAYAAKKALNTNFSISLVTIALNRFLDFFALVIIILASTLFVARDLLAEWTQTVTLFSVIIVVLFVVFLFVAANEKIMMKLLVGPLQKLKKYYTLLRKSLLDSTKKKRSFVHWTISSVIIWLLEAYVTYFLLHSIHMAPNYFVVLLAVVIGNLTKAVGLTPGGTGTYEAGVALTLVALTPITYSVALTFAIVDHVVKKLFVLVAGTVTLNYYGLTIFNLEKKKLPQK